VERANEGTRRRTECPFEAAREMRLIGEARALRDVRQAEMCRLEQAARAREAQREQVLMRRATQSTP